MNQRLERITGLLQAALQPESIELVDDSHQHVGHVGAKNGAGHFTVTVVSAKFSGLATVARHRLVYDALSSMMTSDIHALSIMAFAPDEI